MDASMADGSRRSFLKRLAKTMAVGAGIALLPSVTTTRPAQACALSCECLSCNGCSEGVHYYKCTSVPCQYTSYECIPRSDCSNFCASQNAC